MRLPSDPLALWAFLAGLYEGSGWATVQKRPTRRTIYANLGLAMQDPAPLQAVQHFVGGRMNGPYNRSGGGVVKPGDYRQRYVLMLTKRPQIDRFLEHTWEMLSPRRQHGIIVAMGLDTRDPTWTVPNG
jgi:hypothetical protein